MVVNGGKSIDFHAQPTIRWWEMEKQQLIHLLTHL
jgi:hypothetical protein